MSDTCGIQYCPLPAAVTGRGGVGYCAHHRWPGGEGDPSITIIINGQDGTLVDGVRYAVAYHDGRQSRGRIVGLWDGRESAHGRLRFALGAVGWIEIDPDQIDDIAAI